MFSVKTIDYAAGTDAGKNLVFNELRDFAATKADVEDFLISIKEFEDEWMTANFASDPNAKTKGGKWKYRTYLPKAYSSAKSVVSSALKLNIDIRDKGKTELQNKIKDVKSGYSDPISPEQQLLNLATRMKKLRNEVDSDTWHTIVNTLY